MAETTIMTDQTFSSPVASAHYPSDFSLHSEYESEGFDTEDEGGETKEVTLAASKVKPVQRQAPLLTGLGQASDPYLFSEDFDPQASPLYVELVAHGI